MIAPHAPKVIKQALNLKPIEKKNSPKKVNKD
jgi:hypothetical protein